MRGTDVHNLVEAVSSLDPTSRIWEPTTGKLVDVYQGFSATRSILPENNDCQPLQILRPKNGAADQLFFDRSQRRSGPTGIRTLNQRTMSWSLDSVQKA